MSKIVAIFSGGMDSASMVYMVNFQLRPEELHLLSFDYGQRHVTELRAAHDLYLDLKNRRKIEDQKGLMTHQVIDLHSVTSLLRGSALTDADFAVPDGHYTEDAARITVVPNRNMMMLSIAVAMAVAEGCDAVYTGVHAGDHFVYPDCRPEFLDAVNMAAQLGNAGFAVDDFGIRAPFLHLEKSDIAVLGASFGVPWHHSWSCYKGGAIHCGRCPTCVERLEAFHIAKVTDHTIYADNQYWKTVSKLEEFNA